MSSFPLLHSALEHFSVATPTAVAFTSGTESISYQELNGRANALAYRLLSGGVTPGTCVGVFMPRVLESVVAVYAVLKVGGIMVPLDPNCPAALVSELLDQCEIRHLISHESRMPVLRKLAASGTELDLLVAGAKEAQISKHQIDWDGLSESENLNLEIDTESPAYFMFTSGSTGAGAV